MKRILLAVLAIVGLAVEAYGALPAIDVKARYTDTGDIADMSAIEPFRTVIFRFYISEDVPPVGCNIQLDRKSVV